MVTRPRTIKRPVIAGDQAERLPPGQFAARRWPVLHAGDVPPFDPATWDLQVAGLVANPLRLSWDEFRTLPRVTLPGDLHCVTRWSKLANHWEGVAAAEVIRRVAPLPTARYVLLHAEGDYTANLPLAAFAADDVILAVAHDGETLTPEHGFPVRLVVPGRYAWKSVKWLREITLLAEDHPGFWESYGYHNDADPWREERFASETSG